MVTGAEMLPLIVGQPEPEVGVIDDELPDITDATVIDEATSPEPPTTDDAKVDDQPEAEPAPIANADAPPPDYEILPSDEAVSDRTAKKETT